MFYYDLAHFVPIYHKLFITYQQYNRTVAYLEYC